MSLTFKDVSLSLQLINEYSLKFQSSPNVFFLSVKCSNYILNHISGQVGHAHCGPSHLTFLLQRTIKSAMQAFRIHLTTLIKFVQIFCG